MFIFSCWLWEEYDKGCWDLSSVESASHLPLVTKLLLHCVGEIRVFTTHWAQPSTSASGRPQFWCCIKLLTEVFGNWDPQCFHWSLPSLVYCKFYWEWEQTLCARGQGILISHGSSCCSLQVIPPPLSPPQGLTGVSMSLCSSCLRGEADTACAKCRGVFYF